ncbi:uncharacterized protein V6R79_024869 [Siganus canaliculatus]
MISIYAIIVLLMSKTLTEGFMECDLSRPTGDRQCFGAPGKPLLIHLPPDQAIQFKKNKTTILDLNIKHIEDNPQLHEEYHDNAFLLNNGTFKLNSAQRDRDSGYYLLETFGSDGESLWKINMQLEIQAPASKPVVSQTCLSSQQINISCSSEGDQLEYLLTLDNVLLIKGRDQELKPSASSVTVSFHGELTGNLKCRVQNSVSREETVISLTGCKGSGCSSDFSTVTAVVIVSVTSLLLHVAFFFAVKHFKKRPMTFKRDKSEDEIVYSDVKVMKKNRPNVPQNAT